MWERPKCVKPSRVFASKSLYSFSDSDYLLSRTFEALGAVIEPHQVVATLSCLTSVARPLVAGGEVFPAGQLHMLTLLRLALPGIDPNDFRKSMVCFLLDKVLNLSPFACRLFERIVNC